MRRLAMGWATVMGVLLMTSSLTAQETSLTVRLRSQKGVSNADLKTERTVVEEVERLWSAKETAVIVCDLWDAHHCLNAVRRLEEFAPRMNEVLKEARKRGATIIHSPSDCMAAYEDHAARKRAVAAPAAKVKPKDVEHWCSRIPSEEKAVYPIDQSDGGEDDDPAEHAEWAAKLKAMGRNPGMPWKTQSKLVEIDADRDFISDRGDEVWNVLESRDIKNVILVGVHLNMCVLGRPFGLRQMVRNGKHVALMRDMTDCMYNPKRWPQVDHFTGNDLVVSHVERFVCPTITSDQILGGNAFRSKYDKRNEVSPTIKPQDARTAWRPMTVAKRWQQLNLTEAEGYQGPFWIRCVVRLPSDWLQWRRLQLKLEVDHETSVWLNGHEASSKVEAGSGNTVTYQFPAEAVVPDDFHLLVMRLKGPGGHLTLPEPPTLVSGSRNLELKGQWQLRLGDDKSWSNIPLPAKFGGSTDMLFEPTP